MAGVALTRTSGHWRALKGQSGHLKAPGPAWARLWLSISARPGKASAQILQENFFDAAVAAEGGEAGTARPRVLLATGGGEAECWESPTRRVLAGDGGSEPSLGSPPHCSRGHLAPEARASELGKEMEPSAVSYGERQHSVSAEQGPGGAGDWGPLATSSPTSMWCSWVPSAAMM